MSLWNLQENILMGVAYYYCFNIIFVCVLVFAGVFYVIYNISY